ncbi:MAG TPA: amidase family protein [Baekduia sp.]|uniref:amidase n=1 Tax=Baekduia sp. TaxID=2600305 RepID=UPI002D7A35C2|nr:amidase family protein [Baekduia sp.]HET6510256.1 amidase family protein [Baekduia sp.]
MDGETICWMPARAMAAAIAAGDLTATAVLEAHLDRIARVNPMVNAIVTLDADGARARARAADAAVARGDALGPLHGLPVAVKDLEDAAGMRTTYGSAIFADHVPDADSLMVARLRAAGAIVIGKTNTPELGAGSQTFNPVFGATRNPYDLDRTCGGSSGGAAVAVACGMVPIADGSDLGGSVRNPPAFCSVVGLRPSPGAIAADVEGGDPWESLSVYGPIARTVDDAALLFGALAGDDPRDPRSVPAPADALDPIGEGRAVGDLRVGWSERLGDLPVEGAIRDVLRAARARLADAGARVEDAEPDLRDADEAFDVLRALGFATGIAPLAAEHPGRLKDTIIYNLEKGLALTGARIGSAQRARERAFTAMRAFLAGDGFDVLALPVTQALPFSVDVPYPTAIDGVEMEDYVAWMRSCSRITVTGHPAISVPAGFTTDGLPVGLQLVGRHRGERDLLAVARAVERTLDAARRPPLVDRRAQDRNSE